MRKKLVRLLLATLVVSAGLYAADTHLGVWKLNVGKSKFSPGPGPKNLTVKFQADGDKVKTTVEGVDGEGKPIKIEASRKWDGTDQPYNGTLYGANSIAIKRIDDRSSETTYKKDGKVLVTSRSVVSKDGKTRTVTSKGVNANGQKVDSVAVYEKQ